MALLMFCLFVFSGQANTYYFLLGEKEEFHAKCSIPMAKSHSTLNEITDRSFRLSDVNSSTCNNISTAGKISIEGLLFNSYLIAKQY